MRIGINTAQLGRLADGAAVRAAARAAEEIGYASLWVIDRLPAAIAPRSGYAGRPGEPVPLEQRRTLDPLAVLAVSAAVTTRVRLGTSVLVAPWYRPALLARSLTSLDVLSEGRLTVGLGLGWSADEYDAVAVERRGLGRKLDEVLDVLDAHWSDGPVRHDGPGGHIELAHNDLRPVQRPRPPVLLAAYSDRGLDRIARRADGWTTSSTDPADLARRWSDIRCRAERYGRDPARLQLVVRANIVLSATPLGDDRSAFHGSIDQVGDDLAVVGDAGADEVILGIMGNPGLDELLDGYARVAEALEHRGARLVQ